MNGFPARFQNYEEYQKKLGDTQDAGGFLLDIGEKGNNIVHFLGLFGYKDEEDELVSFVSPLQSQSELESVVKGVNFTPLFRKMLTFVLKCYQRRHMPLIQGMPKIGKTFTYRTFKNLVYGLEEKYIYMDCTPDTSESEIFDAIRSAFTDYRRPQGNGSFLLLDHFDNLPLDIQVIFRILGGARGQLAEEINEWHLGHLKRGPNTFVGFEATYPEIVEDRNTIEVGVAARVVWLAVPPSQSPQYGS